MLIKFILFLSTGNLQKKKKEAGIRCVIVITDECVDYCPDSSLWLVCSGKLIYAPHLSDPGY